MNKAYYFLIISLTSLLFTQSCKKCDQFDKPPVTTTQTVNATLSENTAYTYTLPATQKHVVSVISSQAAHSSVSLIATDANGNYIYQYTPASDYVGTDVVVITSQEAEEHHGGCHGGQSSNHHDKDDQTIITAINLTITAANSFVGKTFFAAKKIYY